MKIVIDDLTRPETIALLQEHLQSLSLVSPPESCHALNLDGLRQKDVTFWTIWNENDIAGCGALKKLDDSHGEIKSMRTAASYLRRGVASQMLRHIIEEATRRGYHRLSLETGSMAYFAPARTLYASFGFSPCQPFGDYIENSNSVFMTREI
jgi:putative acetyltransferase